jgi:GDPmannose 4,6-dehydratase
MWRMMQLDSPDDFVIATGETHSVREFLESAFQYGGLDPAKYVEIDPRYYRPTEVNCLQGDASKAERVLGWRPKVKFHDLVRLMVDSDIKLIEDELSGRPILQDSARD